MSWAASQIIELNARLRLACEALSRDAGHQIGPEDIRLSDLSIAERSRLLADGDHDFRLALADHEWHLDPVRVAEPEVHPLRKVSA